MDGLKAKLAERVLKLFNLGDANRNSSEEEAMAAVTKAREMMLQYNLSLADLEHVGTAKAKQVVIEITSVSAYTLKQRFAVYDDYTAATVDLITDTSSYTRTIWRGVGQRYWQRIFIGTPADVAVASELFVTLLESMRSSARRTCGKGWSIRHSSYCLGYSSKLYERAKVDHVKALPEADQQTVSLMIRDKTAARESWTAKHVPELHTKKRNVRFTRAEYQAGQQDGAFADLGNPGRRVK